MARSKVKYPELNAQGFPNGKYTYCSVEPKTCKKHAHTNSDALEKLNEAKVRASEILKEREALEEKINKTNEELEDMWGNSFGSDDIYARLGLPEPTPVTVEEANAFMEDNIKKVLPLPEAKSEEGYFRAPVGENGLVKCNDCNGDIQLVELKNGIKTWHHPNHAELDVIGDVTVNPEFITNSHVIHADPEWIDENDIERIKLNAALGLDLGYTWRGPETMIFGPIGGEGRPYEEWAKSNHTTEPKPWCGSCGSQAGYKQTSSSRIRNWFNKVDSSNYKNEVCINCGKDRFSR